MFGSNHLLGRSSSFSYMEVECAARPVMNVCHKSSSEQAIMLFTSLETPSEEYVYRFVLALPHL